MRRHFTVTNTLIAINIAIFLILYIPFHQGFDISSEALLNFGAINSDLIFTYNEWYRLLSGMFLHLDITHIAMNMISLYIIGRLVEVLYSKRVYVITYIITGICGSLLSLYISPSYLLVGASGAIFGLFGLLVGYYLVHKNIPYLDNQAAKSNFWFIIGINGIIGLTMPSIDIMAHIGGMISGVLIGVATEKLK